MNCIFGFNLLVFVLVKISCDECYFLFIYGIYLLNKILVVNNFILLFLDFFF